MRGWVVVGVVVLVGCGARSPLGVDDAGAGGRDGGTSLPDADADADAGRPDRRMPPPPPPDAGTRPGCTSEDPRVVLEMEGRLAWPVAARGPFADNGLIGFSVLSEDGERSQVWAGTTDLATGAVDRTSVVADGIGGTATYVDIPGDFTGYILVYARPDGSLIGAVIALGGSVLSPGDDPVEVETDTVRPALGWDDGLLSLGWNGFGGSALFVGVPDTMEERLFDTAGRDPWITTTSRPEVFRLATRSGSSVHRSELSLDGIDPQPTLSFDQRVAAMRIVDNATDDGVAALIGDASGSHVSLHGGDHAFFSFPEGGEPIDIDAAYDGEGGWMAAVASTIEGDRDVVRFYALRDDGLSVTADLHEAELGGGLHPVVVPSVEPGRFLTFWGGQMDGAGALWAAPVECR